MLRGTPSNNNWIKIKLKGTASNSFGIGSTITELLMLLAILLV